MIRFSCPGCQAAYTVGPEKAGKTGKCPKCQSQFSIPKMDGAGMSAPPAPAPSPVMAPAADPDAPVEIAPCPSCGTALTVATQYLGMEVECPTCKNVFAAKLPGTSKAPSKTTNALARVDAPADDEEDERPSKKKSKRVIEDEDDEHPVKKSKRVVEEEDDDDRPAKKSSRVVDEDDQDERPSKKSKRGDDDADDRPKKKKKKKRTSDIESKKVTAGILALLVGGLGIHKFYLGYTSAGIITLLLTLCTGLGFIIALIEGIIYLTKSDEEFIETYQLNEKQWF